MRNFTFVTAALALFAFSLPAIVAADAASAPAKHVQMSDLTGASHEIPDPNAKATILLFVSKDCPYSNGLAPEMSKIAGEYEKKGFSFFFVYGNSDTSKSEAQAHAKSYSFSAPCILDSQHKLVNATGAHVTPEAFVFDSTGTLLYHGRVDNRFDSIGVQRTTITSHDLIDALDQIDAGKTPTEKTTQAIGCTIHPL